MFDYRRINLDLLNAVQVIAIDAGDAIMKVYESGFEVDHKSDETPVTTADKRADQVIQDGLSRLVSQWPVLSEENLVAADQRLAWETYWLVDPLDGTKEFIRGTGEFTVNIALVHQYQPILSVIYVPVLDISYLAIKGHGAWRQHANQARELLRARETDLSNLVVLGSRSHGSERYQEVIKRVEPIEQIGIGSSLKFCMLAEGRADLYLRLGPTSEWDTAAAQCILQEAGGYITKTDMQSLRYNTKVDLLNPEFIAFGATWNNWAKLLDL